MIGYADQPSPEELKLLGFSDAEIAGINCFFNDEIPKDPQNEAFMQGWVIGWGMRDKLQGASPCLPLDPDYFRGYRSIKNIHIVVQSQS